MLLCAALGATLGATLDVNCTASASDVSALIDTIDASSMGDTIRIHGLCIVDKPIPLRGDRSYFGDSRTGTIIRQKDGANLPALLASDGFLTNDSWTGHPFELASLTLDGNRAKNNGTSVLVVRSWQAFLHNLHIIHAPVDGIRVTNLAMDGTTGLKSTQVNGRISNCFIEESGAAGIRVLDTGNAVTDWNLLDSWVANSGTSAVLLDNAAGWQIRGLHTYGSQEHAIFANRCFATSIVGNYVEDFGHAGSGTGSSGKTFYGIVCHAQASAASLIASNRVHAFRADPNATSNFVFVGVSGVARGGVGVVNVHGNVVRGANRSKSVGLSYRVGSGKSLEIGSTGNHIVGVRTRRDVGENVDVVPAV